MTTRKRIVTGVSQTRCGSALCHCSHRVNHTLWDAIGPALMIAAMDAILFSSARMPVECAERDAYLFQ